MFTATSFNNPRFAKKIRRAFWICKMQSIKTKQRATGYVKNKKGNNSLRLDVMPSGELICYAAGQGMRNYASLIVDIVEGI